jgi:hypothetical protein
MLVRLANVLYWAFVIAALIVAAILALIMADAPTGLGKSVGIGLPIAVGWLVWLVGWAVRYVLSGQR